jgi:ribonuclease R
LPAGEGGEGGDAPPVVCEVAKRGKLLVGEPFFDPRTAIVLDRRSSGEVAVGDLVVVQIGRGRAKVSRVLGPSRAVEPVLEGLLYHTGTRALPELEPAVEVEAEALPLDPAGSDPGRVDLRQLLAFTIDPDDARDFDDAISVQREGDGLRVWIHIADVASYVQPGSALDRDAARRALSVYVPGRVEPMLPERLSAGLCSLVPHRDRACLTVEVSFSSGLAQGEPLFYRSLIRSRERLTYSHVEAIVTGRERVGAELEEALRLSQTLAGELRRRRYRRGALRVETGEISFAFDGAGGVERAWVEAEPLAHALVEEHMILANEAVAGLLASRRREALYRVHERPDPQAIELLLTKLEALDVPTPAAPAQLTAGEAAKLVARVSAKVAGYTTQAGRGEEAFSALVLRALKQARYDPRNLGHSGLASSAYCHFTSPIRRYPDVICHRALLRELGVADDPPPADLPELAEWASVRERESAHVEYAADAICLAWLLESRLFDLGWDACFEGEVTGVIGSGIFVRFDGVFEGYVPARRLPGDYFEIDPLGIALVGRRTNRRYRLGDPIAVTVESVDRASGKVNLALCENSPSGELAFTGR